MYAADGVGLAACQIGVDLAVFVFDCPDESGTPHRGVVCNPELHLPEGKDRRLDDGDALHQIASARFTMLVKGFPHQFALPVVSEYIPLSCIPNLIK